MITSPEIKEFNFKVKPSKYMGFGMRFDITINDKKFCIEKGFLPSEFKQVLMYLFDESRKELEHHFKETGILV